MHLKQLGKISDQVMEKLHDIITPVDERVDIKEWEQTKKVEEAAEKKQYMRAGEADRILIRRAKVREEKNRIFAEQTTKPDRDILMSGEDTTEYNIQVNN